MKKQLLLLLILPIMILSSCSKSSDSTPIVGKSGYIIHVKKNSTLSTGQLVANDTKAAAIQVWKADGRTFSITSPTDAVSGYAYDSVTKTSVKSDYTYVSSFDVTNNVDPGDYFVFVILPEQTSGTGSFAYSYTNFTVKKGEVITLTKIFSSSSIGLKFQDWNLNN